MKTPFLALLVLALSLFRVSLAQAEDLTGTWTGQITDPAGGKHEITLVLKTEGGKLTGTLTGGPPTGEQQTLVDAKLDGEQLSFTVSAHGMAGESIALSYQGKVTGNRIQGSQESPMGNLPWEVTRK